MIIPSYPQEGFPVSAQWGRQVVDALRSLRVRAGRGLRKVAEDSSGTVLEATAAQSITSARVAFSGTAYIAGNMTTGLNSDSEKRFVRCFLDTATAEENAGPPPNPFPINEEWYEKAQTPGDIHIPRA